MGVVAGQCPQGIEGADLAICPEDVARQPDGSFDRVIRFGELAEVFTRHGVRDALTVFLDTCYTGSGDADAPTTRHLLGNQASPLADAVKKALAAEADAVMASRLILGARHWKPAYELRFEPHPDGLGLGGEGLSPGALSPVGDAGALVWVAGAFAALECLPGQRSGEHERGEGLPGRRSGEYERPFMP